MASPEARTANREPSSESIPSGLELALSDRERRGIRFSDRYPWVPAVALTVLWLIYLASVWHQFGVLAEHGGGVGISSRRDVWSLALSWSEFRRPFQPYEVFVIDRVNAIVWEGGILIILSFFLAAIQQQNRLVLKLCKALRMDASR